MQHETVMSTDSETCGSLEVQCSSALHERTSVQLDGQTKNNNVQYYRRQSRPVVPNRGVAATWDAIYSAQGCRGLTRFFTISLKIHFQAVIKPQSKLPWVRHYGCRKLLFFSVGCRKPKKVGKHWSRPRSPNYGRRANPARQDISTGSRRHFVNNE